MTNEREMFGSYAKNYQTILKTAPKESQEYFRIVWKIATSEISPPILANEFEITEGVISRYIRGRSQPMENSRRGILERLTEMLSQGKQYKSQREVFESYAQEYARIIEQEDSQSPKYFSTAIKIAASEVPTKTLADEFKVSEPTIRRYIEGRTRPHELARPIVLERLGQMLNHLS